MKWNIYVERKNLWREQVSWHLRGTIAVKSHFRLLSTWDLSPTSLFQFSSLLSPISQLFPSSNTLILFTFTNKIHFLNFYMKCFSFPLSNEIILRANTHTHNISSQFLRMRINPIQYNRWQKKRFSCVHTQWSQCICFPLIPKSAHRFRSHLVT